MTEDQQLLGSGGGLEAEFGAAVALVETETEVLALVGAPGDAERGFYAGAVYAYRYDEVAERWEEEAKFWPETIGENARVGFAVQLSDDGQFAFANGRAPGPKGSPQFGRVHVFRREAGAWVEDTTLAASDETPQNSFGCTLAVSADSSVLAVGACAADFTGAVYVFRRDGVTGAWAEEAKLTTERACFFNNFGSGVDISAAGDRVVVGEPCGEGFDPSALHFFHRTGGSSDPNGGWEREALFDPANGGSVALSDDGNLALAGPARIFCSEIVEVYGRSGDEWRLADAIVSGGSSPCNFGGAIALGEDLVLIGDEGADIQHNSEGAAFLFRHLSDETWMEEAQIVASDGEGFDRFGRAVSLSDRFALVGAPFRGKDNFLMGVAYSFELSRVVSAEPEASNATSIALSAYPNPFVSALTLVYTLPQSERVRLAVYDVLGREVTVLVEGWQAAGEHHTQLVVSHLPSGPYVVRLETETQSITHRVTLLK